MEIVLSFLFPPSFPEDFGTIQYDIPSPFTDRILTCIGKEKKKKYL